MTNVTLVYPYFRPFNDKSIFRFPPLGSGYIAAYLGRHNISVDLVDCTFLSHEEAVEKIRSLNPNIIGIYSMFSMKDKAMQIAKLVRRNCELLVAGGPLPTLYPEVFLQDFDVVVIGEGEETMLELVSEVERDADFSRVKGIAYREKGKLKLTPPRGFIQNLDSIPFPVRELFDNQAYKNHYSRKFGYTITSMITSRGCPFNCDFCSQPIFGNKFRTRSAANIVDEIETVLALGYERIWFADDCFTLNTKRLVDICNEIIQRRIKIDWECLSRVDTINRGMARVMKQAGCVRVFFGMESGNDSVLALMKKRATTKRAKEAVYAAKQCGIQVGAFFIVGYPGETDKTVLDTVKFASSLPLDYLSFTLPYPIPGTPLYDRVKDKMILDDWKEPKRLRLIEHKLLYHSSFSEAKLKFAILKASVQFELRKYLGAHVYKLIGVPFERLTDIVFKLMR
ncbi:MAG: B12-binding domain-containing radical SAM protein [Candidatus Bathyarchaeia archaeon]